MNQPEAENTEDIINEPYSDCLITEENDTEKMSYLILY